MTGAAGGEDGWGPWIVHDGLGCPVPVGTVVLIRAETPSGTACTREYFVDHLVASCRSWRGAVFGWRVEESIYPSGKIGVGMWVTRYRLRNSASFEKLKRLAEAPPPVRELEPA